MISLQSVRSALLYICYFTCGFLFSGQVFASSSVTLERLLNAAQQNELWNAPHWRNLLHYEADSDSPAGFTSQVDDARFFNAPDGKTNPESELLQTLQAFYKTDIDSEHHAQCRYIARLKWLQQQLATELVNLPAVDCKEYSEWRKFVAVDQVTLIFPAYHLNSPSSMFGHTLLRLDHAKEKNSSDWLSVAVNFGANITQDDNSLFYAFKGLTGGYPGFFIVEPYFKKIQEYNQKEKRDIWEYPLNLTQQETQRMVEHLWELKEMEFDYYFFDENCSYRLLELLEVARPGIDLTSEYGLTVIPVDTVRAIKAVGLTSQVHYRPSQVTVLENLLQQIDPSYQHYVSELTEDTSLIDTKEFKSISIDQQKRIIQTAYKYLRYKKTDESRDKKSAATSYQLLSALSMLAVEDTTIAAKEPSHPEDGHYTKRTNIKTGRENEQNYVEVGIRMAFHSLEDNVNGFLQGAQINMANLQLRGTQDESVKLQRLDVVDIFSLTPRTALFDPWSWKILTGMERQLTDGTNRLVTHVSGGAGLAYDFFDDALIYGLVTLRLEHNRGFADSIEPAVGIDTGLIYHFASSTARLELSGEEFSNNEYRHRVVYSQNFVLSQNHSIKFSYKHEAHQLTDFDEFNLAYQYYFF